MVRSVAGIVVGCTAVFALGTMAGAVVFHGTPPQAIPGAPLATMLLVMNGLAAIAGGYLAAAVARRRPRTHGLAVGVVYVLVVQLAPPALAPFTHLTAGPPLWFTAVATAIVIAGATLGGAARHQIARG